MQAPTQLFPSVAFQNGKPFNLEIDLMVPSMGTPVTIEKVHLVGNKVFMLCQVSNKRSTLCAIGTSTDRITVKLPDQLDERDVKVSCYVLGKDWGWSDKSYANLNFINTEAEYKKIVGLK